MKVSFPNMGNMVKISIIFNKNKHTFENLFLMGNFLYKTVLFNQINC